MNMLFKDLKIGDIFTFIGGVVVWEKVTENKYRSAVIGQNILETSPETEVVKV